MSKYKVIIAINGEEYEGEGKAIPEAIDATGLSFFSVKTKGTITIIKLGDTKKDKTYQIVKFFLARQMKRLFSDTLMKKFWHRDMEKMFEIMKEKKLFKKEIML